MHPLTQRHNDSVAALGEEKLIAAIRRWLGNASPPSPFGIGDDCAVLTPAWTRHPASFQKTRGRMPRPPLQLITVDPVIYRRHFNDSAAPRAVGEKLLKRNLSDIAAMGGRATAAVISLTLDARTSRRWVAQFYRGLAACARRYRVAIVGGDVAEADGIVAATLTLIGEQTARRVVARTGARVGDWIFVTGELGNSVRTGHHFRFAPRLAEGAWLASRRDVRAMIDVSDGLAKDLRALTPHGAVAEIAPEALPRRRGADVRGALTDGEDYELLFALAARARREEFARAWRKKFPRVRLTCLGRFVPAGAQSPAAIRWADYHGYEHLR